MGPAALDVESVPHFEEFGIRALTTRRESGSFGTSSDEPVRLVMERWALLQDHLSSAGPRLATARQVHGRRILVHSAGWEGWLRGPAADGHASFERGTGMAVSIADCVPVFIAHPSGAAALLHSGWRGTEARIIEHAIDLLAARELAAADLSVHLGPAICGRCYEVSVEVFGRLTGRSAAGPTTVDLRALIADHARGRGVRRITATASCTRCDNELFFSHRAGDTGRQLGVMIAAL